jgi:mRNA-degrading endonuclease RelE of RelBE toxin-antitoxin system
MGPVKTVLYTLSALKDLRRHETMAKRIRKALGEYAADGKAHANNVTRLTDSPAKRLRIDDFRAIFEENDERILVTKIGPRGGVYG